ncbi:MAG: hypothetical protein U5O69_03365 [Candidatus Competibacteraceae bacterium]|nr:hypothetical protein [Candidatus Competibacteraceae bacterium]
MIRITTHHEPSRTIVAIEGRLTAADFSEIRRVRQSVSGAVALDLGGLDACAHDGIRLLQDWLDAGAQLDGATPFLPDGVAGPQSPGCSDRNLFPGRP